MRIAIWAGALLFLASMVTALPANANANGDTLTTTSIRCTASTGGCYSTTITYMYYDGAWIMILFEEKRIPNRTHLE